jgi:hypothetical protein
MFTSSHFEELSRRSVCGHHTAIMSIKRGNITTMNFKLQWTEAMIAGLIACADYNLRNGGSERTFTTLATGFLGQQCDQTITADHIKTKLRRKFRIGLREFALEGQSVLKRAQVQAFCDDIVQAHTSLQDYLITNQTKVLREKEAEIDKLKESLQNKEKECYALRLEAYRHQKEMGLTSTRNKRRRNNPAQSQEAIDDAKKSLDRQTSRIVSYIGPMTLFDDVELPVFESIDISKEFGHPWHKICGNIKNFSKAWAEHICPDRWAEMVQGIQSQETGSEAAARLICAGPAAYVQCKMVHEMMDEVFGCAMDCHDRYPLALLDDVFRLLSSLGGT